MRRYAFLALAAAGCVAVGCAMSAKPDVVTGPGGGAFTTAPLTLDASDPERTRIGALRYMGGVVLRSADSRFGGISGLRWQGGGLHAITDRGDYLRFEPAEARGRLLGARALVIRALAAPDGVLEGKDKADAEALSADGAGGWLVSFERDHRIWRYAADATGPVAMLDPEQTLGRLDGNAGVEALAATPAGLFYCAERMAAPDAANCRLQQGDRVVPISVAAGEGFVPTDADQLDDGSVLILMRHYTLARGVAAVILRVSIAGESTGTSVEIARIAPPVSVDNMEGLAVRHEGGHTYIYIISDDNFSPLQRTLLMKFRLEAPD